MAISFKDRIRKQKQQKQAKHETKKCTIIEALNTERFTDPVAVEVNGKRFALEHNEDKQSNVYVNGETVLLNGAALTEFIEMGAIDPQTGAPNLYRLKRDALKRLLNRIEAGDRFLADKDADARIEQQAKDRHQGDADFERKSMQKTLKIIDNADAWEYDDKRLTDEQVQAVRDIVEGTSTLTILTGEAGTGKSLVVNFIREKFNLTISATTGKAAVNVHGITVDRIFKFRRNDWTVSKSFMDDDHPLLESSNIVVIDEMSACGYNMLNILVSAAEFFSKRILLVGDYAQTMPVKDEFPFAHKAMKDAKFINLKENHRQSSDKVACSVFNEMRNGQLSKESLEVLRQCIGTRPDGEDGWVLLYATNKKAEEYNQHRLAEVVKENGEQLVELPHDLTYPPGLSSFGKEYDQKLEDDSAIACRYKVALGAQLLVTRNSQKSDEYVNGDVGTLVGYGLTTRQGEKRTVELGDEEFDFEYDMVGLTMTSLVLDIPRLGGRIAIPVHKDEVQVKQGREPVIISGFPVRLGYALTIHKSQGMTIEKVWVSMESIRKMPQVSRHGMAYVAASRATSLDGLRIDAIDPTLIVCAPEVRPWI